jgi:hypothetical protein
MVVFKVVPALIRALPATMPPGTTSVLVIFRFESGVRLKYRRSFGLKGTIREGSSSSKSTVNLKNDTA